MEPRRIHPVTFFKDGDVTDPQVKDLRPKAVPLDAVDEQPEPEAPASPKRRAAKD